MENLTRLHENKLIYAMIHEKWISPFYKGKKLNEFDEFLNLSFRANYYDK